MRNSISILCILFISWGTSVFSQNSNSPTADKKIVSGMVLKNDKASFDHKAFLSELSSDWKIKTDSGSFKDQTLVFMCENATVMVANMNYPLPKSDISAAAEISWLWKSAEVDAARHQSYLLISVIGKPDQATKLYKLFTKIAACALENTNSSGVYMHNQYLLLSKGYYQESAKNMSEGTLPIYLWVYFGILQDKGQSSGYTYGLREFGMQEMEIVNSDHSLQEVHACIYDAANFVLMRNLRLQDGETINSAEDNKIPVSLSDGAFLEEKTLKLKF